MEVNKPLFLDTNAILQFFRGADDRLCAALSQADRIYIPFVAYAELQIGFSGGDKRSKYESEKFAEFISLPNVDVRLMTLRTAAEYARIFRQLKKQGTPIPVNDIWIAAEVFEVGGILFSYDRHFGQIPMLDWIC